MKIWRLVARRLSQVKFAAIGACSRDYAIGHVKVSLNDDWKKGQFNFIITEL